ncbi:hypothetical protein ACHHYP_14952 [Achlya hypogyna]|uniref:Uncharacterized protein n=1 Tax=Achlya hypogyna TaxID=1202772 RepID=A0A1V9YBT8_ACHHY|nr:hypothetical protein ACHHYP_14952 [Achlya hypogyna]
MQGRRWRFLSPAMEAAAAPLALLPHTLSLSVGLFPRRLLAVHLFHGLYGHAAISPDFVVPDEWGYGLAGMRLGADAQELRLVRRLPMEVGTVVALDDAGFVWDVAARGAWPDIVCLLTSCRTLFPNARLVDGGGATAKRLPLGGLLTALETHREFASPAQRALLATLGVDVESRWTIKYSALRAYFALHCHVIVPLAFVVPANDERWPPQTWHLPLGFIVHWLRQIGPEITENRRADLDALDFCWFLYEWEYSFDVAAEAFGLHKVVPESFVVPRTYNWPFTVHGLAFGQLAKQRAALFARLEVRYAATLARLRGEANPQKAYAAAFTVDAVFDSFRDYTERHKSAQIPFLYGADEDTSAMPLGFFMDYCRRRFVHLDQTLQARLVDLWSGGSLMTTPRLPTTSAVV